MNVLVTGASGFLGRHLCRVLAADSNFRTFRVSRNCPSDNHALEYVISSADDNQDWSEALSGKDVVIHTAGLAHVVSGGGDCTLSDFMDINARGTINLALQAARHGIKRFIFISSIGVNGRVSRAPFTEIDLPDPADDYAHSKWTAERGLWGVQNEAGMEIVIIRPPLIYGPNAPGNFGLLVDLISRGIPLPLGDVRNKRTFISLHNLVDFIITCINHPNAANQVFLVGDGQDLSTTELIRGLAEAAGMPVRLIPFPASLMIFGATLLGKKSFAEGLFASLQIDSTKARTLLKWNPPLSIKDGLRRCFIKD